MDTERSDREKLQEQEEPYKKHRRRYLEKSREIASKYLQKLEELPGAPENFAYFTNILRKVFIENEAVKYRDSEKFVGSFCIAMPSEVIYASGARPLNLCGGSYMGAFLGDYVMPRDVCPTIKSAAGNATAGWNGIYDACDMYVVPISCNCKKKLADYLSNEKPTVPLYLPLNRTDDGGMDTYVKEIKKTAEKISEITGVKITRAALEDRIKIQADVQKEIRLLSKFKRDNNLLIRGSHALAIMNSMAYDDISAWGSHLKKLNEELFRKKSEQNFLTGKKMPRILLTGSPITFPNMKIPLMIEEQGGIVVADEICLGERGTSDLVSVCENSLNGYYKALANRYVKPCSCPIFPENAVRIRKIEKMAEESHIDGIVYHVLRGCLIYDYEFEQIEKHFHAKGIPVIRLESDFGEEDVEQLRIRIEAFIEMAKFKN